MDAPQLEDLEIVNEILDHRLRQDDIQRILAKLQSKDAEDLTRKVVDVLGKTSALLEIARRVADSMSLDVLLPKMVELVSEFLRAERSTIFLYDEETDELFSKAAQGDGIGEIRFSSGLGIAGAVLKCGEPLLISDAYADERFNREVDRETGFKTRDILCVPISHKASGVIGVIQVLNRKDGEFQQVDVTLLQSVATQAAAGFENARLHHALQRARAQERGLLDITTAISKELEVKPLLRKVMESVTQFLEADRSTLFLHDPRTNDLWSQVAQGVAEIRFPCHLGIAGSVFQSGETINIPDAYADDRFNPAFDKKTGYRTRTILCMPVQTKAGDPIGVIQVLNKAGGPFTQRDERRLEAFGAQAAIAIENARLFEEVVRIKNYNESILRSMSNGVITLDAHGDVAKLNDAALRLLGLDSEESQVGHPLEHTLPKEAGEGTNAWLHDVVARVRSGGERDFAPDARVLLPARDDTASVNVTTLPLTGSGGESLGCMLVIEDLTKEKRLRNTMARYISKEVADKLLEEGESALGGTSQPASVLFSDIRSFTTMSERLGARETVAMLNDYFSIMVDLILDNGGILDKYIGDAIMAVFGAPFPGAEDADNSLRTAIGMMTKLTDFNAERIAAAKDPVLIGIGINTDEIMSGNIGSEKRMDYTVIGDGVNLAARLEGANKPYGTEILISEFTRRALKDSSAYMLREVDLVTVKGKTEPVAVHEAMDHFRGRPDVFPNLDDVAGLWPDALATYRSMDWEGALRRLTTIQKAHPEDRLTTMYIERCRRFQQAPPAADWDGVYTMKSK